MSKLPQLYCPFPKAGVHPQSKSLIQHSLDWTRRFRLLPDETPRTLAKVRSYSLLAASCYPRAPFERLSQICDYYSWLFFFDDACEDLSLDGASPGEVAEFLREIYGVLNGGIAPRGAAARFGPALKDIWSRVSPECPPALRARLIRHVDNYIDGCVWEAQNRRLNRIPSCAVFQTMRMYTSTLYEFWDFVEYAGGFCLPDEIVDHPLMLELQRTANAVASFSNDIFSFRKEKQHRDFHNLVSILQHERSLPLQAAYTAAASVHDAQVRHFLELERLVPSFGGEIDRNVTLYLEGMRIWMRANYDWSVVTPRYVEATELDAASAVA